MKPSKTNPMTQHPQPQKEPNQEATSKPWLHLTATFRESFIRRTSIPLSGILAVLLLLAACGSDPASNTTDDLQMTALVVNEGVFQGESGSITGYSSRSGEAQRQRFQAANGTPIGGIIQSASLFGDELYIVVNETDKIEITDAQSLERISMITFEDFPEVTPVAFVRLNAEKGYVSSLPDFATAPNESYVYVIDLDQNQLTGEKIRVGDNPQLPMGANPQQMALNSPLLYVTNNGYGYDNSISVIDTRTDEVTETVTVGRGPVTIKKDNRDRLWVISSGLQPFDDSEEPVEGQIDVIDGSTAEHLGTIETGGFPHSMAFDASHSTAWVTNETSVQQIDMTTFEISEFVTRQFKGIGFANSENRLYLAQSRGYNQSGQALIYDLNGAAVDSFQTGIAPYDFLFPEQTD